MENEPDINLQLDYVFDNLSELKEGGLLSEQEIRIFLTRRDLIERMEDEERQNIEKAALLKQYRNLIRNKRPQ